MATLINWVSKNGIITFTIVIWAISLVSWVTYRVFGTSSPDISGTTAAALATVYGLPAVAVGLWKWKLGQSNTSDDGQG